MKRWTLLAAAATLAGSAGLMAASARSGAWSAPLADHRVTRVAGYEFTVYPGFSHRAVLRDAAGRETELYRQTSVYYLPGGHTQPAAEHQIRLEGGPLARDLGLTVNDPKHQVARITVELYGPDHVPGHASPVTQTLVVENNPITCPDHCDNGGPP